MSRSCGISVAFEMSELLVVILVTRQTPGVVVSTAQLAGDWLWVVLGLIRLLSRDPHLGVGLFGGISKIGLGLGFLTQLLARTKYFCILKSGTILYEFYPKKKECLLRRKYKIRPQHLSGDKF